MRMDKSLNLAIWMTLSVNNTSMDVDPSSVSGETQCVHACAAGVQRHRPSVKSDLWGRLLDTTLIDVMWVKHEP